MLPEPDRNDALFLDFDGTLVELAPRPADVVVPPALLSLLEQLQVRLAGAVAVISGRPIEELDRLLAPLSFVAAGEHGAEIRYSGDEAIVHSVPLPSATGAAVTRLGAQLPGTVVEIKTASAALHFRNAPEHQLAVIEGVQHLAEQVEGYELLQGKMVAEIKLQHINKGVAIRDLASRSVFVGRRPVYIGDDITDEAGFSAVNELEGLSIRAGKQNSTQAQFCVNGVRDVHEWLARLA